MQPETPGPCRRFTSDNAPAIRLLRMGSAGVRHFFPQLQLILRTWRAAPPAFQRWNAPATEAQLKAAETELGIPIPGMLRRIYEISNGAELLGGNLMINGGEPLVSFPTASSELRRYRWLIPENVQVFGGNGQGDLLGLWIDGPPSDAPPVVEIGQLFESGCMALVGTSFDRFLLWWTALYLQVCEAPPHLLDMLRVPSNLRSDDPDDELIARLCVWADPNLIRVPPSPYKDRLTPERVRDLLHEPR